MLLADFLNTGTTGEDEADETSTITELDEDATLVEPAKFSEALVENRRLRDELDERNIELEQQADEVIRLLNALAVQNSNVAALEDVLARMRAQLVAAGLTPPDMPALHVTDSPLRERKTRKKPHASGRAGHSRDRDESRERDERRRQLSKQGSSRNLKDLSGSSASDH